jgi:hypothetical protein
MKQCEWHRITSWQCEEGEEPEDCFEAATYTNCEWAGCVVCRKHRCRCSRLLWLVEFEKRVRAAGLPWHAPHLTRDATGNLTAEWIGESRRMGGILEGADTGCWFVAKDPIAMDGPYPLDRALEVYKKFVGGSSWGVVYQWKKFIAWLTSR